VDTSVTPSDTPRAGRKPHEQRDLGAISRSVRQLLFGVHQQDECLWGPPELARRGPAAAGSPLVLLVAWVAAFALVRGVTNIARFPRP